MQVLIIHKILTHTLEAQVLKAPVQASINEPQTYLMFAN